MHILIPVFFNAPLGGLHYNVLSTALHCKKNGHDVTVLCKPGIFTAILLKKGIKVINTDYTPESYNKTIKELLDLNRENKINVIHSHPFESRKIAKLLSRILDTPFFVTIHGRHTDHIETYISEAAMIFTVSEGIKDFVKDHLKKKGLSKYNYKLFVVHNGVNTEIFQPENDYSLHSSGNKRLNISLVTRLDKDKEFIINIFYKALKFTHEHYPQQVEWTIVGDGSLQEEMKKTAKELVNSDTLVKFVGWKEGKDLLAEYNNSDIVVAPGRCALEAMSCGKPVIAIGSKGYVGIIDRENWLKGVYANFGGIGNKIEDYQENAIEEDIQRLVEDISLREELRDLGPNIVNQFYNEEEANSNILRFYKMYQTDRLEKEISNQIEIDKTISSYLLEQKVRSANIAQPSPESIKVEIICDDLNGLTFAWYIYKDGKVVKKIPYSISNSMIYTCIESGIYRVRCYVKKGEDTFVFPTKNVQIFL